MISLIDYVKKNRTKTKPDIKEVGFGEMFSNVRSIYYDLPIDKEEYSIFAFVAIPTSKRPKNGFPAVLLIHGGNGAAYYEIAKKWADNGYVAIAPDFNGMCSNNLLDRCVVNKKGGPKGYGNNGISTENPWTYFSVLSAMRAIDVLISYDFVDKNKICSCGLSWGGFLNLSLTAFDKRICASSIIYSSAFILDSEWGKMILNDLNEKEKLWFNDNHDPKNYLSKIKIPTFFTGGTDDKAFKMLNRQRTADLMKGDTYFGLRKSMFHANFFGFEQPESIKYFNAIINNKKVPQPSYSLKNDCIKVKPFFKDSKINVIYTKEDLKVKDMQTWINKSVNNERFVLPKGVKAFFIEEKTKEGTIWSSKLQMFNL